MSSAELDRWKERWRALRENFDGTFALPEQDARSEHSDFLAVRVAGDPYALRLSELLGLSADKKVVLTPSRESALLGLAGFRGTVTPVFDLGRLLGYPPSAAPRWIALTGERTQVGLAFEGFEAHLRVGSDALIAETASDRPGLRGAVRQAELTRPILDLKTLLSIIEGEAPESGAGEER